MFKRAYIEITDICNLNCFFCIGTKRKPKFMSADEFEYIAGKVRPFTDYIYLHIMGEPLLHPQLEEILKIGERLDFKINITTNGTLISEKSYILQNCDALRKLSVSLHSFEGNESRRNMELYLENIWSFCENAKCITELRLWNEGGKNSLNEKIIAFLSEKSKTDILSIEPINGSRKIRENLYLGNAEIFDWPSLSAPLCKVKNCYGLKTQFGILCDGSVVPCCLDSEGTITLGNVFNEDLEDIFNSERAKAILKGFNDGSPCEELCKRCSFAERFGKSNA